MLQFTTQNRGFTLLEILVVTAIISIFLTTVYVNFTGSYAQARDAERKANVQNVATALELYKNKYGRYPEACNGPIPRPTPNPIQGSVLWSGEPGTADECPSSGDDYIVGLAPEFIEELPTDPRARTDAGYVYAVNYNGSAYKFMAMNTVENETVTSDSAFFRCGQGFNVMGTPATETYDDEVMCLRTPREFGGGNVSIDGCHAASNSAINARTYAVSAGIATEGSDLRQVEHYTEIVRCG
jgi:prepilin-type N-terminal cleavage/methylation domain-containing protein